MGDPETLSERATINALIEQKVSSRDNGANASVFDVHLITNGW